MPDTTVTEKSVAKFDVFKLAKRRSCELVNTPSPCVKKALFHLERLKVCFLFASYFTNLLFFFSIIDLGKLS